jgi:DNA-binding MarR family transcriptional regulator
MKANRREVAGMMTALQTVLRSTERAQRKGDANRLLILSVIAVHPNSIPKAISEEIGIHASSITRQVQALEKDGFLNVSPDLADGRSCRIALTASGQTELERLREIGFQRWSSFVAKWNANEVRSLTRLLVKLEQSKQETGPLRTKTRRASWRPHREEEQNK